MVKRCRKPASRWAASTRAAHSDDPVPPWSSVFFPCSSATLLTDDWPFRESPSLISLESAPGVDAACWIHRLINGFSIHRGSSRSGRGRAKGTRAWSLWWVASSWTRESKWSYHRRWEVNCHYYHWIMDGNWITLEFFKFLVAMDSVAGREGSEPGGDGKHRVVGAAGAHHIDGGLRRVSWKWKSAASGPLGWSSRRSPRRGAGYGSGTWGSLPPPPPLRPVWRRGTMLTTFRLLKCAGATFRALKNQHD